MSQVLRTTLHLAAGGRIVIPAGMREMIGLKVGSEVVLIAENDRLTLLNAKTARRKAREKVRQYVSPSESLSKELMAERKMASRHE